MHSVLADHLACSPARAPGIHTERQTMSQEQHEQSLGLEDGQEVDDMQPHVEPPLTATLTTGRDVMKVGAGCAPAWPLRSAAALRR